MLHPSNIIPLEGFAGSLPTFWNPQVNLGPTSLFHPLQVKLGLDVLKLGVARTKVAYRSKKGRWMVDGWMVCWLVGVCCWLLFGVCWLLIVGCLIFLFFLLWHSRHLCEQHLPIFSSKAFQIACRPRPQATNETCKNHGTSEAILDNLQEYEVFVVDQSLDEKC